MKQIIDFLRKIGLLHVSSGDYETGEFDSRKDLKEKKTKVPPAGPVKGKKVAATAMAAAAVATAGIGSGLMILFWVLVTLVVAFLLNTFNKYGFSFWFLISTITWFFFFKSFRMQVLAGKLAMVKMIIIFVVLFFFSRAFLIPSNNTVTSSKKSLKESVQNKESDSAEVNQAQFSGFIFGSSSDGGSKTDTVNLAINPILNFSLSSASDVKVVSLEIENLEFTKKPALGEIKRIAPKHNKTEGNCTGFYFGGCDDKTKPEQVKDDGKNISYEVVEGEAGVIQPEYYDQVFDAYYINPAFKIVLHNIGEFDYDKIMEKNKVVDGRYYADYAGIEASDLASVLELDVIIKMSDGEKIKKHFTTKFNGEDLIKGKTVISEY